MLVQCRREDQSHPVVPGSGLGTSGGQWQMWWWNQTPVVETPPKTTQTIFTSKPCSIPYPEGSPPQPPPRNDYVQKEPSIAPRLSTCASRFGSKLGIGNDTVIPILGHHRQIGHGRPVPSAVWRVAASAILDCTMVIKPNSWQIPVTHSTQTGNGPSVVTQVRLKRILYVGILLRVAWLDKPPAMPI